MKKIYLTLFVALGIQQVSFGQWVTNGDHINNTNVGNVGIGTSSPLSLLHVKSSLPMPLLSVPLPIYILRVSLIKELEGK